MLNSCQQKTFWSSLALISALNSLCQPHLYLLVPGPLLSLRMPWLTLCPHQALASACSVSSSGAQLQSQQLHEICMDHPKFLP